MHENGQRLDAALGDGFAFVTSPERRDHVETLAGGRSPGAEQRSPPPSPSNFRSSSDATTRCSYAPIARSLR